MGATRIKNIINERIRQELDLQPISIEIKNKWFGHPIRMGEERPTNKV